MRISTIDSKSATDKGIVVRRLFSRSSSCNCTFDLPGEIVYVRKSVRECVRESVCERERDLVRECVCVRERVRQRE